MKVRILAVSVFAAAVATGCSNKVDSDLLLLTYKPPRGVELIDENAGPPKLARFTSGIDIRSVDGELVLEEGTNLEQLLKQVARAAGVSMPGTIQSSSLGMLHANKVARYELKDGDRRTMVYLVAGKGRYVMFRLSADEAQYPHLQSSAELSLASLHLHDAVAK